METKQRLEIDYDRARVADLTTPHNRSLQAELREQLVEIDRELGDHLRAMAAHSNPYWGPVGGAGADESLLAQQVERYACVYASHRRARHGDPVPEIPVEALDATARPVGARLGERPLVNHQTLLLDDEVVDDSVRSFPSTVVPKACRLPSRGCQA